MRYLRRTAVVDVILGYDDSSSKTISASMWAQEWREAEKDLVDDFTGEYDFAEFVEWQAPAQEVERHGDHWVEVTP